jgi:hypothetical protein
LAIFVTTISEDLVKLKPADARRFASLSALAAGALVAGAGDAEAGTIIPGNLIPSNGKVGFSSGYTSSVQGTLAAALVFHFRKSSSSPITGTGLKRSVRFSGGPARFKTAGGLLALFSAGQKFGGAGGLLTGTAAWRSWFAHKTYSYVSGSRHFVTSTPDGGGVTTTMSGKNGHYAGSYGHSTTKTSTGINRSGAPFADKFALFSFPCTSGTCYGWLELSLDNNALSSSTDNLTGPDLTLEQWYYDDSGAQIAAGDTVSTGVPEPGNLATTGLAALILGAAGVRRWRASKPASKA